LADGSLAIVFIALVNLGINVQATSVKQAAKARA